MGNFIIKYGTKDGVLKKYTGPGSDVIIPDGVTEIGWNAFYNCRSLTSVTIPEGVTSIGSEAFARCTGLTAVTIPDSVIEIGDKAFCECSSLQSVTLPAGVMRIGDGAFRGCVGLQDEQGLVIVHGVLYECVKKDAVNVIIPEGVTEIGGCAFSGCKRLTSVIIPNSVTKISYDPSFTLGGAFECCKSLTSVAIPDSVTSIGNSAFSDCSALTNVTIPDSVTEIGQKAFSGCRSLQSVTIPAGVTTIAYDTFSGCGSLQSVTIPDGVTEIGSGAFSGCGSLQSVTIPDSVTSIGWNAFARCTGLTAVTIPDSVIEIGENAFYWCESLTSVRFENKYPKLGANVFGICSKLRMPLDELRTDAPVPAQFAVFFPQATDEVRPYIILFQTTKAWREKAEKGVTAENADSIVSNMNALIRAQKKLSAKAGVQAAEFAQAHQADIRTETLQALAAALEEKKCGKALEKLSGDPVLKAKLDGSASGSEGPAEAPDGSASVPEDPIEALVREHWVYDQIVEKLLTVNRELKYAGSDKTCSKEVMAFVIAAYVRQAEAKRAKLYIGAYERGYLPVEKDETADRVAAALDREGLLELLEQLTFHLNMPECAAALGRYADEARVTKLLSVMKKWGDWLGYGRTGRERIMIARGALMLNDTRAAMLHMEKVGQLEAYAKLRGTDAETLRDTVLADFGFDADGKKRYDLGGRIVAACVGQDLKIALFDETAGKAVKSLPKKGADPEKHAAANADLSDLKKNVKKVAKARSDRLFGDFLSGNTYDAGKWQRAYLGNPVLHRVAELLVWSQGKATFTLGPDGPIQSDGAAYAIMDAPIAVAHPVEMIPAEVAAWQRYFAPDRLKQPFEQVWEPVADPATIRPERYEGQKVSVFKFMHMEKHGIYFEDGNFHEDISFSLEQCTLGNDRTSWHWHEIAPDETFTLGKFSFKQYDRRVNHIVALLDRWTVAGRILKDDVSVRDVLDGFTAAQIMEYIRMASENACPNCAAMLLAYKRAHYPDFDPLAEFTLE